MKCKCGGSLEVVSILEGNDGVLEVYRCMSCSRTGRIEFSLVTNMSIKTGDIFERRDRYAD
jgi:hypothetical protein